MEFSKEKMKQIRSLLVFAAFLVLVLMYSEIAFGGVVFLIGIIRPFIYGGIIAFVLNLPMKGLENGLFKKWNGKVARGLKRPLCMLLSVVAVSVVITIVISLMVPQITKAFTVLGQKIPPFFNDLIAELENLSVKYPELENQIAMLQDIEFNWDAIMDSAIKILKNGVGSMLTSTVSVAGSILGGIVNAVIAFIFALYILSQKEKLADQGKRILSAYLPGKVKDGTLKVLGLLHVNFSNFITGQCLEAVILGTLFVIAMTIFGMPYAMMVGVLIGFTSLIPIVGAFIGCAVGAFLIVIENPMLAFWFIIMFLIIQQIEGNLIYPKVVGNSVGLPSIWVLVAVSLGGSMFGVAGMLFFIPLLSTAYALLREGVNKRNMGKEIVAEVAQEMTKKDENTTKTQNCVTVEKPAKSDKTSEKRKH